MEVGLQTQTSLLPMAAPSRRVCVRTVGTDPQWAQKAHFEGVTAAAELEDLTSFLGMMSESIIIRRKSSF